MNVTWRSLLLDISDFVSMSIDIQSIVLENTPALIRSIGYNPNDVKLEMKLWNMLMIPYGSNAGGPGSVGGQTAIITQE